MSRPRIGAGSSIVTAVLAVSAISGCGWNCQHCRPPSHGQRHAHLQSSVPAHFNPWRCIPCDRLWDTFCQDKAARCVRCAASAETHFASHSPGGLRPLPVVFSPPASPLQPQPIPAPIQSSGPQSPAVLTGETPQPATPETAEKSGADNAVALPAAPAEVKPPKNELPNSVQVATPTEPAAGGDGNDAEEDDASSPEPTPSGAAPRNALPQGPESESHDLDAPVSSIDGELKVRSQAGVSSRRKWR